MEIYDDKVNQSAMNFIFMIVQMLVLMIVYLFAYSSLFLVKLAIEKEGVSAIMYFPILVAIILFPVLLYNYRKMFKKGKMLMAFSWMMGTASLTIVLLYAYIYQFSR